jgi:toxin ParE1/3/4
MTLIRSAQAEDDLIAIWGYIAQDNLPAADRMLDVIDDACHTLCEYPHIGVGLPDIHPEYRYFPVQPYLVIYRVDEKTLTVLRILHGAREWRELL